MIYNYDNCAGMGVPREAFVDGVKMDHAIEADTENGYVLVAELDEKGRPLADGDELATRRVCGVVTVVPAIDD